MYDLIKCQHCASGNAIVRKTKAIMHDEKTAMRCVLDMTKVAPVAG